MNASQFLRLIRIPTLAATAVPIMVGASLGAATFSALGGFLIFVVALLLQMGTNALNEYGDYRHAVDTEPSPGFAGLIVSGEVGGREVLLTAVGCFTLAFALGTGLVLLRGPLMLVLGVAAILAGALYSEGPVPISSTPFGELLVALVMGPVEVVSADLAVSGRISDLAILFSIPVSLMVTSILLTNNVRDIEKDRGHGRKTLAVMIGRRYSLGLLFTLILLTFMWSLPAFFLFDVSPSVFLLWLAFPLALWSYRRLAQGKGWSRSVAVISRLHILVGALLTISILLHA